MIRSTTFFSVADARQYHCTYIDSSHRDALHDYIVSVLIGNFCLFTTLVFEICVTTKIFGSCRQDERFFVLTLLADRLLLVLVEEVKVPPPPLLLFSNWKKTFLEIVIDTGITYNKSGVADPNPGSGVSLTQGAGSVMAKNTNPG
jgi:hypothetical protein